MSYEKEHQGKLESEAFSIFIAKKKKKSMRINKLLLPSVQP